MRALLWSLGATVLTLPSCSALGHGCTAIGCRDGASFTLTTADGTWPEGTYALTLALDGTAHACSLTLPRDLPERGAVADVPCVPPLPFPGVQLGQDAACEEDGSDGAVRQSCTPIPEHYSLTASVAGTPAEVSLTVTRDGSVLLERSLAPSYVENRPNGEGCEPVCQAASAEVALPPFDD